MRGGPDFLEQFLCEGKELTVVAVGVVDVMHRHASVPRFNLLLVRRHDGPLGRWDLQPAILAA
jgi:hypothetical protein